VTENVNQQQVIRFQGGGSAHREPTFEPTSRRPTLVSSLNPRQNGKKLSWDGLKGNIRLSDKPVGRIILGKELYSLICFI